MRLAFNSSSERCRFVPFPFFFRLSHISTNRVRAAFSQKPPSDPWSAGISAVAAFTNSLRDSQSLHSDHDSQRASLRFRTWRSEEHTSELQSLMRISYAVFCLKKKLLYHIHLSSEANKTKHQYIIHI